MSKQNWYRIDVEVVNAAEKRTEWRPLGYARGVRAAARLRRKYRQFVTRRVIVPPPVGEDRAE